MACMRLTFRAPYITVARTHISSAVIYKIPIVNSFSTTSACCLDQKWREKKGLSKNPNAYGPLTNLPDYSYLDGRPTPLSTAQKDRYLKQKQYLEKVVRLTGEINFAEERYKNLEQDKMNTRQRIIDGRLKPKGSLLTKNKLDVD